MSENRASEAKSNTTTFYAFGIAGFAGALSVLAMVIWLVNHVK
jgi:hypothetical protein